jgi:acyl-CoA synthetase (AMP-forming)/AMP-acid ligase II
MQRLLSRTFRRFSVASIASHYNSITEAVLENSAKFANRRFAYDFLDGRSFTYTDLKSNISSTANGLLSVAHPGDTVAIFSPNSYYYTVALHGALSAGMVVSPASPQFKPDELALQLKDSGSKFLYTINPLKDVALAAADLAGIPRKNVIVAYGGAEGCLPFESLLTHPPLTPTDLVKSPKEIAVLPYSSGTTGPPKGVELTHANLISNMIQMDHAEHFTPQDVVAGVLPFFHIYGLMISVLFAPHKGAQVVMFPKFDFEQFLTAVQTHHITYAPVVPPIIIALAKHPMVANYDLSSLRVILSGAAPLGKEIQVAVADRLGCVVKQAYGMTEMSPVSHFTPTSKVKIGSIGVPVADTDVKVVDLEAGTTLPVGGVGEICVRGPQVMKGYHARPQETAKTIDGEGFLHTGDIGYADGEGYYFVVDRKKELIKYKGHQVSIHSVMALTGG